MPDEYILGNMENEIKRLELQAAVFAPISIRALHDAGIRRGMRCIDIGCGSGSVTRFMAGAVGNEGRAVGVDIDEKYLEYCRSVNKHRHVDFVRADISDCTLADSEKYDIVFSRFLFVHLKDKNRAVQSMKRLLKDSGVMIIQELDHSPGSWLCHPADTNVELLRRAFVNLLRKTGGDPLAGRKLYKLLVEESLDSEVSCFSPCLKMGHEPYNSLGWRIMDSLKPQLIGKGIVSKQKFAAMREGLQNLSLRKDAFVTYARFFSVSGRK